MKVYLAGEREHAEKNGELTEWIKNVRRRLFSYYYHGLNNGNQPTHDVLATKKLGMDMFLDSGAFTAFTKDAVITPEAYAQYIHNTNDIWTVKSSLDAIGDPAKSYEYLKALESLGVKVQPVFHAREDDKWLIKYLDEGYDYIFIGGMVPETTKWLLGWLDHLFDKYLTNSDGTARVKLHGFGLTDQTLMFRYPWYSVDSSSWLMTGIFGSCLFWTPQGARKVVFSEQSPEAKKMSGWHYTTLSEAERSVVDKWLEPYGITAEQCMESYIYRDAVNAKTFQDMEYYGTKTFIKQEMGLF